MKMSSNRKIAAVVLTTVALSVASVGFATASESKAKSVSVKSTSTKTTKNAIANPMSGVKIGGVEKEISTVLASLVTKGTITQAQSDAITAALTAARVAHEGKEGADRATKDAARTAREALVATTIGIDAATIKTRLAAGETLGAIAGAKKAALIAALVAAETNKIDAAVTAGKLTVVQATTLKSGLTAHVTAEVDSVRGAMGPGKGGKKGGPGHGDMDDDHGMGMHP
ncbi:unannotated protein [freshwater metagenome]|uniref:Unannotated protein n=1 Tax=freshwater metagenome TaxID=449393 RepID=A0A6J7DG55_9ZZZZ